MIGSIGGFVLEHWTWFAGGGGAAGLLALVPVAGPALAFLRANWTWAVPSAIAIGAVFLALWYRGEWKDCQASVAIDAAKAEEKVRVEKEADARFTRQLEEKLRPVIDAIQEQGNATTVALAKVKSDPNCMRTPAAHAFDGIVQPPGAKADPGPSRPARP